MRILIAPAKKMKDATDDFAYRSLPVFLSEAQELRQWLLSLSHEERKKLWACSEKIALSAEKYLQRDLQQGMSPALLAYDGIQYTTMEPSLFDEEEFDYLQQHLRILSGFYGALKPFDGIIPYRLEMQAKGAPEGKDLYAWWGEKICEEVRDADGIFLDLASEEYSRAVSPFLKKEDRCIRIVFAEEEAGKLSTKGVYAKIARGDSVRWLAEHRTTDPEEFKAYDRLGYRYVPEISDEVHWYFVRKH